MRTTKMKTIHSERPTVAKSATNDLNLATYLSLSGIEEDEMVQGSDGVEWVYETSDLLHDLTLEYRQGRALVNPQSYNREFGLMRQRMHDFINRGRAGK